MKSKSINLGTADQTLAFLISGLESVLAKKLADAVSPVAVGNANTWLFTLLMIERHPGIRPSGFAEMLVQDRSAAGRVIDTLEAQGYVRRERSVKDGRAQELHLTSLGLGVAGEMAGLLQAHSAGFFSDLSPFEVQYLTNAFRRVYERRVLLRSRAAELTLPGSG